MTMTRKKVNLTYITNNSKRKATFKKRRNGLIKKIDEISTLCGIEACAIIYSSNEPQPEVWPSHMGVQSVVSKFRRMPEPEQTKKMFTQESFLRQSIMKAQEQLKKKKGETRRKEMSLRMFQCLSTGNIVDNVNMNELADLTWLIDQNLMDIERKVTSFQSHEGTSVVANGAEAMYEGVNVQGMMETHLDAIQNPHWSMESVNGGGNIPFGHVNLPNNDIWPGTYVP